MTFSERQGLKPAKIVIQLESMDDELRIGLWNNLTVVYWAEVQTGLSLRTSNNRKIYMLLESLWIHHFKKPVDMIDVSWSEAGEELRNNFFTCTWNEVYDFLEFVANNYPDSIANNRFEALCNETLEKEVSGYRFIGEKIAPITSDVEIGEIEKALSDSPTPVSTHLKTALDLFADRDSPDYRNSVKESISAVEAMCRVVTGSPKETLGQALNAMERDRIVKLHPAQREAFIKLYGYTSDADGIRHSLLEDSNIASEDAMLMLANCTSFVNYLNAKAGKAGIAL